MANNNHTPPKVRPTYDPRPTPGRQSAKIVSRLLEFDRRRALLAEFEEAVANLVPDASARRYEESLAKLGDYLGFDAERPEQVFGTGPDVLWRTDGSFDFVIEAKSKKVGDNPLYKKDHSQLLEAEQWFKSKYPDRGSVRVSALPVAIADAKATTDGTFAFRLSEINKVVGALRGIFEELVVSSGEPDALRDLCENALQKAHLKPESLKAAYFTDFLVATP